MSATLYDFLKSREGTTAPLQNVEEIEQALGASLGAEIRLEACLGRVVVYRKSEVLVALGEVRDCDLVNAKSAVEALHACATHEVQMPPYIVMRRSELQSQPRYRRAGDGTPCGILQLPTSEGPVPFETLCSDNYLDLRKARNDLAEKLNKLIPGTTLVLFNEPKEYQDAATQEACAWADCVFLGGVWEKDATTGIVTRVGEET